MFDVDGCMFGAARRGPLRLACFGLPELGAHLFCCSGGSVCDFSGRPHRLLSRASDIPHRLAKTIADVIVSTIKHQRAARFAF